MPGKRDEPEAAEQATGAGLLEPGSLQAGGSETVNLTLLPAQTAVPRNLRLLVAQSFHFFQRGDKKGKIISAVKSCWRCRHSYPTEHRRKWVQGTQSPRETPPQANIRQRRAWGSGMKATVKDSQSGPDDQVPRLGQSNLPSVKLHCNNQVPCQFQSLGFSFGLIGEKAVKRLVGAAC